jgi:regulator of protease activity HflC (stomatin/prohibitin superfamily)
MANNSSHTATSPALTLSLIGIVIAIFLLILMFFGSYYTVDEGERGILLTNGRLESVEGAGLHFKVPMFQSVKKISTRTQTISGQTLSMYSYDQQTAELAISVTFHIAPEQVEAVYTRYGEHGIFPNAILPRINEVSKTVFGKFTAERAIQERNKLNEDMNREIKAALADVPVIIENIQIENLDFSDTYERAVEQAAKAKADVERAKSELARVEQEAQQKVKNAEAEAAATKAQADAAAYSIKVQGEAEANAIRERGAALRENPDIIRLTTAQRWNGILPTTMTPNSALPFIDLK